VQGDLDSAIIALREATALDTSFAMAYRGIGVFLRNLDRPPPSIDSALAAAYRHRDRLSERERYLAEGAYFQQFDREKAAATYRALLGLDPHSDIAAGNLGNIDLTRRQYAAAETLFRREAAAGVVQLRWAT
jgi:tetratricopeptide (TPR) repeat protein